MDTAKQEFPNGEAVNGSMGVFRWFQEHLDVLLLGAVLIAIGLVGSWVFGLETTRDADSKPRRRNRKRRDDEGLD
ncbi:MAG TPA: hypothetical protein VFK79_12355 [Xanthobacteraceae bacterium]|nr:hypothetical protein [Xanthobacteraceae bacterium]